MRKRTTVKLNEATIPPACVMSISKGAPPPARNEIDLRCVYHCNEDERAHTTANIDTSAGGAIINTASLQGVERLVKSDNITSGGREIRHTSGGTYETS